MCRINPRVDFAFKKLFGSAENKDLLISLINAIISEQEQIVEVELMNPFNLADYQAGKMSILDIKAKSEKGVWINVEMQISEDIYFDKRAIYYWAKLVTEQLSEGRLYKELKKTISININIMHFSFSGDVTEFHSCYKIMNTATGKADKLHDIFELYYVELSKFAQQQPTQIITALDRWSTFLTKAHQLDKNHIPAELAVDAAIVKAISAVDRMFDEEERLIYEIRMQSLADIESIITSANDKGFGQGMEQGLEQGIQQGLELTALNMLAKGMSTADIAEVTGLSTAVILELASKQ